ncbi:MAG: sulfurtransferase TusA family protein [Firmicutes bacterium]|jgi:tRNA 2-thiouridine synthesizing protein A|nr:sulfurtransferase TusA family protein [Bacillota bacterium]
MDHKIDAIGEFCPIPIIRAEVKLTQIKPGDRVIIITDHTCSSASVVSHFQSKYNYPCRVAQIDEGIWEIIIAKEN